MGEEWSSVSVRVAVPLARKIKRGSGDFRRSGTKVCVIIWVPVTFVSQEAFQASRIVSLPWEWAVSKLAPGVGSAVADMRRGVRGVG